MKKAAVVWAPLCSGAPEAVEGGALGAWMRAAVAYLAGRRRVQQNRQRKMTASQQRYSLGVLVCRLAIAAQGK